MRRGMQVLFVALVLTGAGCGSSGDEPSATLTSDPTQSTSSGGGLSQGSEPEESDAPTTAAEAAGPAAPDASPYIVAFGDISGVSLPDGDPGEVSIIASGTTIGTRGSVPMIVRNNTGDVVGNIEVSGTARDAADALVGSGASQGFQPKTIEPGEIAFGYVYFDTELTGSSFAYDFTVNTQPPNEFFASVTVTEVNNTGDKIIGTVANEGDGEVTGPIRVETLCFNDDGTFRVDADAYVEPYDLPVGGTGSFSIDLFDAPCPNGLIAASGY